MGELGHELWVGDAARITASEMRYHKNDYFDAKLILDLLRTGRFPRIWLPPWKSATCVSCWCIG